MSLFSGIRRYTYIQTELRHTRGEYFDDGRLGGGAEISAMKGKL